jgi:hypothetical protein
MATIANLDINLKANVSKYNKNMQKAGLFTRLFGQTTKKAGNSTRSFQQTMSGFAVKGAATVAVFGAMTAGANKLVKAYARIGDEIGKAAARTQLSTDDLQTLSFAFEQNGGSAQELETSIKTMSTRIRDLSQGVPATQKLFEDLGITFEDLENLDTGDRFRLIADSLKNIADESKRSAAATDLFGRSGRTMLLLTNNMAELEDQFKRSNLLISEDGVKGAEDFTDKLNLMDRSFKKLIASIGPVLTPIIQGWTMMMSDFSNVIVEQAEKVKILASALGLLPRASKNMAAINGATDTQFRLFLARQKEQSKSRIVRRRLKVDDGEGGQQFLIDKQIASQKQLIEALKNQSNQLAPLPQALLKGSSAQIDFVAQLQRQNQQAKIDQREKKKIDIAEKQLKKLEEQRDEEFKDKKEISIV